MKWIGTAALPCAVIVDAVKDFSLDIARRCVVLNGGSLEIPHSCNANAVLYDGVVVGQRKISDGETVTLNMNLLTLEFPETDCNCGAEECNGHISGFVSLPVVKRQSMSLVATPNVRDAALGRGVINMESQSKYVQLKRNDMGLSTYAACDIPAGVEVFRVSGYILPMPTMYTIQIDEHRHLAFSEGAECLAHSCNPNVQVAVDKEGWIIVTSLTGIPAGDLISFNYLTTEYRMNSPFDCLCGASSCFGGIGGFSLLSDENKAKLWPLCTTVVKQLHSAYKAA